MAILKYKDKNGNFVVLPTGGGSSAPPIAKDVSYDNSLSGLVAGDTQAAIDELSENVIDYSLDETGTGLTIEGGLSVPRNQIIHCEVYKTGGSDYNYTGTALPFDTIITNEGECYNSETGLFTCPQDGMYLVNFTFFSNTTASTNHRPAIFLNNTAYVMSDGQYGKALTATISCKKNDTISIGSYSSSYNINFFAAIAHNLLTITLVNTLALPNKKQQHHYSTDEQVVGTWVDGKPIYEKVIPFTTTLNQSIWIETPEPINDKEQILQTFVISTTSCMSVIANVDRNDSTYVRIWNMRNTIFPITHIIIQYTKTTD